MRFTTPYFDLSQACRWLRGNHHGHSTLSDGNETPQQLLQAYEAAGYGYLALSEHDLYVDPVGYHDHTRLILLPAVESTSVDGQTLMHLGAAAALPARELTAPQLMDAVEAAGGLFVFDHPNWKPVPAYATDELLDTMEGLRGMEIYCGVIERLPGEALATDRWDRLLSRGWQVWGHGTDDQHTAEDRFVAWNCVQVEEGAATDAADILQALRDGRFYASTGVALSRVGLDEDGQRAVVDSDGDEIHWVSNDGRIIKKQCSRAAHLTCAELLACGLEGEWRQGRRLYARAECLGRGSARAWTQPFWLAPA